MGAFASAAPVSYSAPGNRAKAASGWPTLARMATCFPMRGTPPAMPSALVRLPAKGTCAIYSRGDVMRLFFVGPRTFGIYPGICSGLAR